MPTFEELRALLAGVRIAHHIRGRIRLRLEAALPQTGLSSGQAKHLNTLLDRIPGVHSVRANLFARSCTVEYDPGMIPEEAWRDFLTGAGSDAAAILERILRDTYREVASAKP